MLLLDQIGNASKKIPEIFHTCEVTFSLMSLTNFVKRID